MTIFCKYIDIFYTQGRLVLICINDIIKVGHFKEVGGTELLFVDRIIFKSLYFHIYIYKNKIIIFINQINLINNLTIL